jgi:hypothetical protein
VLVWSIQVVDQHDDTSLVQIVDVLSENVLGILHIHVVVESTQDIHDLLHVGDLLGLVEFTIDVVDALQVLDVRVKKTSHVVGSIVVS